MWFQNEAWGVYWLTDDKGPHNQAAPTAIPQDAPFREYDRDYDWVFDTFEGREEGTGRRITYRWLCNPQWLDISQVEPPKIDFPKNVTLQNLAAFFTAHPKKDSLRLSESITVSHSRGTYFLNVAGARLVGWGVGPDKIDRLYWYPSGNLQQAQVDALRKHLGLNWKLIERDELVGLEGREGWTLATVGGSFTLDGRVEHRKEYDEEIVLPLVKSYAKLRNGIARYVETITADKIRKVTSGMAGTTHSILTRCDGCQSCNGMHLEVHMARGDLDAFLMYSAFDAFGPPIYGGAVRQTWDLIADPTTVRVAEFREAMRKFLLDTLRPKLSAVCFMPTERNPKANLWKLFGTEKMGVADGLHLVPAQRRHDENYDNMRDGEWLAQEVNGQARRRPAAELRRRAVEFAEALGVERAVAVGPEPNRVRAWFDPLPVQALPEEELEFAPRALDEVVVGRDPFDMNLDLDEEQEDEEF